LVSIDTSGDFDEQILLTSSSSKLDNIEANISSADRNVGKGVGELRQAAGYLDSARTKMCCIIVTILIIVGIVVGALVLGTVAPLSPHRVD